MSIATPPGGRVPQADLLQLLRLFSAGRHGEMEALAAPLAARHPQDGMAWKALGTAQLAQGKDALAAEIGRAARREREEISVVDV